MSIGSDHDCVWRQRVSTNNKNQKRKYPVRIMLRDTLGFTEHQGKDTYGLGYKLTLTEKKRQFWIEQMRPTMPKLKLVVLNGTYKTKHLVWNKIR